MTSLVTARIEPTPKAPAHPLDKSLVQGIGWTGGMRWLSQVMSWIATLVVARLLTPADYGLVGMALVYSGFVELVSDFGVGAAIVQRRRLDAGRVARLGGVAVALGVLLFVASLGMANPIARFYGEPAVAAIVMALAFNFVVTSFQVVPQALLVRELQFRRLAWVQAAEMLSLVASTVTLAVLGAGYWALVLGLVVSKVTGTALALLWRGHRIAWPWPLGPIASEITFGFQFTVSHVAWYAYNNADFLIVGRVLGKVVLGVYTIAWSLASVPVERIAAVLGNVFRGIFSAVQDDQNALARYLCMLTEGLAIVTFPVAAGLALVADDGIGVLLGDRWLAAVAPLRLLALYAMVRSITTLFAPVLVATGHTRLTMRFNLVAALVMPVAFLVGTRWGTVGVAVGWIVGYSAIAGVLFLPVVLRIVDLSLWRYLRTLLPATLPTVAMAGVVLAVRWTVPVSTGVVTRLLMEVGSGVVSYLSVLWLVHGPRLRDLERLLRDALRRPVTAPAAAPATR